MGAGTDVPGIMTPEPPTTDAMNQICVPLVSLAQADDTDAMQNPEVGDAVTLSVEGTVDRVEGSNAYVTPTAFNGTKVETPEAPMNDDALLAGLQGEAANMPIR